MIKKFILVNILVILILALFLIVLTFFDLTVSELLYNPNSNFAKFFEDFGELPGWLIAPFVVACLFFRFNKLWVKIIAAILLPVANYFWANHILNAFSLDKLVHYIILAILITTSSLALILSFKKIGKKTLNVLFIVLLAGGLFVLADNAIVQLLKIIWGRVRYRDLRDNFSYWFIPKGITKNKSFPSGHTSSACALLIVILFCKYYSLPKWTKIALIVFSAAFIIQVALTRIIIGAHYATDVIFAILLAYILFSIADKIAKKFIKKEKEKQYEYNQS